MIMVSTIGEKLFLAGCVLCSVVLSVVIGHIVYKTYRDWKNEKEN